MRSVACLLGVLAWPAAAGTQASIELLPEARVGAGTVVLGQVARLHSGDIDVMRKLVHLPVGQAPGIGNVAVLQRDALAHWVRQRVGLHADAVDWSGAQESRVLGAAAQLAGDDIARAAVESARAQLAAAGRAGDVKVRIVPRDVPLPTGDVRMEVRGLEPASWTRHLVVWVDIWAGGGFVRTVPIALEMLAGAMPPAAALADAPLLPDGERMPAPAPLREPAAVTRGDWAVLRSGAGGVALEMRVEVLQDGRPGQKVRVRQNGAGTSMLARVVGRNLLELVP